MATVALGSSGIDSLTDMPRGLLEDKATDCNAWAACSVHAWAFAASAMFEGGAAAELMMGTITMVDRERMTLNSQRGFGEGRLCLSKSTMDSVKNSKDHQAKMMGMTRLSPDRRTGEGDPRADGLYSLWTGSGGAPKVGVMNASGHPTSYHESIVNLGLVERNEIFRGDLI